jgi:ABC-2 type transport system permease protein
MNALNDSTRNETSALPIAQTRLFAWSLRRELWEHRSIYVAPLVVAAFVAFGLLFAAYALPSKLRDLATMSAEAQLNFFHMPYSAAAMMLMATMVLIGSFYCIEALYAERRDRSILFWKSLPMSDAITVLAKIAVPLIVLPILTFFIITCAQIVMLLASTVTVYLRGMSVAALWAQLPFASMPIGLAYFIVALTLWYAPVYCWLLFISAWAKRGTFAWAIVPPLAIVAIEQIAWNGSFFTELIKTRLVGVFARAFSEQHSSTLDAASDGSIVPDPVKLLTSPELWLGLAIAVALLIATIKLRSKRDPI